MPWKNALPKKQQYDDSLLSAGQWSGERVKKKISGRFASLKKSL
jgi:hypothetical protein